MNISLNNIVIIFDEGHNMEKALVCYFELILNLYFPFFVSYLYESVMPRHLNLLLWILRNV
jgi:hypothetical protein